MYCCLILLSTLIRQSLSDFFQIPMAGGWADCAAKKASSLTTISKKYSIDNDNYGSESTVRERVAMT